MFVYKQFFEVWGFVLGGEFCWGGRGEFFKVKVGSDGIEKLFLELVFSLLRKKYLQGILLEIYED